MHTQEAALAFQTNGVPITWQAYGQGHINQTLKVTTDTGAEYILQRINKYVFKDPVRLMGNISAMIRFRCRIRDSLSEYRSKGPWAVFLRK